MKKSQKILLGISLVFLAMALIYVFGIKEQAFQFAGAQNSVRFISEDSSSITYEIIASSTRGQFLDKNSADSNNGVIDAGFGETTSSDSVRRTPQDVPENKFISNILIIEGLEATDFTDSGNEVSISDIRLSDMKVECTPQPSSNILVPNTPVKDDIRAQMFGCKAFANLKAFYPNGTEAKNEVSFFGGTSAKTTIVVYKHGFEQISTTTIGNIINTYTNTLENIKTSNSQQEEEIIGQAGSSETDTSSDDEIINIEKIKDIDLTLWGAIGIISLLTTGIIIFAWRKFL